MKFYINRLPVRGPWGGGAHFINSCYEFITKPDHQLIAANDSVTPPDAILLVGVSGDNQGVSLDQAVIYKMFNPAVKIFLRVNENDARKGTRNVDAALRKAAEHIDGTIFVSHWLQKYFVDQGWPCKNQTVIYNGVNGDVFKPIDEKPSDKIRIVAHHWSNNRMKGFDIYEEIDKFVKNSSKFEFTYIGRHNGTFSNTRCIKPLSGVALGSELAKHDVYVSASRFDPGPNHILESLSCKLPTYVHKDGGGCVEFAGDDHVFSDWDELRTILESENFEPNEKAINLVDWKTSINDYVRTMESWLTK